MTLNEMTEDMFETKVKDPELVRQKQKQICQGALKVFRNKGFHAASIREIARAAGLSIGSLYDYIEKKEDILFLVHRELMDQIYGCLDQSTARFNDPREQLTHLFRDLLYLTCQIKEEALFIYTETKSLDRKYLPEILRHDAEFVRKIEALIKRGINRGVFECADPHVYANIVVLTGALIPLRGWNVLAGHNEKDVVEEVVDFLLKGLGVTQPPG